MKKELVLLAEIQVDGRGLPTTERRERPRNCPRCVSPTQRIASEFLSELFLSYPGRDVRRHVNGTRQRHGAARRGATRRDATRRDTPRRTYDDDNSQRNERKRKKKERKSAVVLVGDAAGTDLVRVLERASSRVRHRESIVRPNLKRRALPGTPRALASADGRRRLEKR